MEALLLTISVIMKVKAGQTLAVFHLCDSLCAIDINFQRY